MIWVAWRQFRTQALVTLGLLAAFAALVIGTGIHVHDLYDAAGGTACGPRDDCPTESYSLKAVADVLDQTLRAIPALLGIFWGAPLVARELESGTFRLAWTQSITRRRWLAIRVALVGVAALAVAGVASWLVSWWAAPIDAVNLNRLEPGQFDIRGIVAVGYAGFAFGLAVATGALLRRTLPAMATTLVGFVAARFAFTIWLRPHLPGIQHALFPVTDGKSLAFFEGPSGVALAAGGPPLPNAWSLSAVIVDRAHHALSAAQLHDVLARTCPSFVASFVQGPNPGGKAAAGVGFQQCTQTLSHHLQLLVAYQPAGHYWPLQALEAAIFLAAGLALIGATVWRIGHRRAHRRVLDEQAEPATNPVALVRNRS
jgi:hypothetical protein